jgi:hypothetical protein
MELQEVVHPRREKWAKRESVSNAQGRLLQ